MDVSRDGKSEIVSQKRKIKLDSKQRPENCSELLNRNKFQTYRRWNGKRVARRRKLAAVRVHVEYNDRVAQLIFDEHEVSRGVERKMARLLAAGGHSAHLR